MKKIFILGIALLGSVWFNAQVGINTTTPTTTLQIEGKDVAGKVEGVIVPRFTGDQIFNMPISTIQTTVTTSSANSSNLVYATSPASLANQAITGRGEFLTTPGFFYWDHTGQKWRRLFVATSSAAGNDGVVKVNSGAGGVLPTFNLLSPTGGASWGARVHLVYTTPLIFADPPTTSWPETSVPFPGNTSSIYIGTGTTQRWRENPVQGQVHVWRLIATVTPGNNSSASVLVSMENPDSGFNINSIALLPSQSANVGNRLTFYFYTIADPASLDPNIGYQFFAQTQSECTFQIESLTRVSLFKD